MDLLQLKEHLEATFVDETIEGVDYKFKNVFFKHYDRKILAGEISFKNLRMSADKFILLSTAQEVRFSRRKIIDLCLRMNLNKDESEELIESAGFQRV